MDFICDAHSHYMPPEVAQHTTFFKQYWSDYEAHLRLMDEHRIAKALLLYPTTDAHLNMGGWAPVCTVYNAGIAGLMKRFPDRFVGAGIVPVDGNMRDELRRIDDYGLKAVSLASSYDGNYLDHERFYEVFEFCSKRGFPVHVHPQIISPIGEERVKDPLLSPVLEYVLDVSMSIGKMMMEGVFQKFPDVKFIFAHYGGVLPFVKERFDTTYAMLRGRNFVKDLGKSPGDYFRNLYFDMSGSKSPGALATMLEVVDAERLMWGSDFPANRAFGDSLQTVRQAAIPEAQKNAILSKNFLDIISK